MVKRVAHSSLTAVLERDDLTLDDLTRHTERLLTAIAPEQTRYKVTARPDARTVRYYVSQGLLPRPVGHQGGRARYAGTHVLRLLLIKQQQARHQTLRQIGEMLQHLSDSEIAELLWNDGESGATTGAPQAEAAMQADIEQAHRTRIGRDSDLVIGPKDMESRSARQKLATALEELAAHISKMQ